MLVNLKEIFKIKGENGAVGAFNLHCLEMLPSFFKAAKESNSPIIIQLSVGTARYIGYKLLVDSVKSLIESTRVDVCLHLDHCENVEEIKEAIDNGFTSVMIDGSKLNLENNIAITNQVLQYAKNFNVSVEAELGTIGGTEEGKTVKQEDILYTRVNEAEYFLQNAAVDALAISIGTAHGLYKGKAEINITRLKEINSVINIPLVLHGGTGVSDADIKRCIENGIKKVNVGTEQNVAWIKEGIKNFEEGVERKSLRNLLIPSNIKVEEVLKNKIALFNL